MKGRNTFKIPASLAKLSPREEFWREKQHFLLTRGYKLRPRYHPDWKPSWNTEVEYDIWPEDAFVYHPRSYMIDATRMSDGKLVQIRRVYAGDTESSICNELSKYADDKNHAIPVLDYFKNPTEPYLAFMVVPFLRQIDDPPFETVGDVVDFVSQILEGLVFLHDYGLVHGHCTYENLAMDTSGLYPKGFHPIKTDMLPDSYTPVAPLPRSGQPIRYYFTNFKKSVWRSSPGARKTVLSAVSGKARHEPDKAPRNHHTDQMKSDVEMLGHVLQNQLYSRYSNLEFLKPLIDQMVIEDLRNRSSSKQALIQWSTIKESLSWPRTKRRLRSRQRSSVFRAIYITMESLLQYSLGGALRWRASLAFT
ncbi:hypothetical protein BXZ70DRAFT_884776 [Cristinia sonorae]|uniref:Protein kinase domain-containing protein n=1 Tax=Cristinia sonorae TaxID=1940300 RepID=A0A8K0XUS9_9AGAR|nr:hypothetical protein BXZ70DRAFT_884776 [Cristinia sonorae]